MEKTSNEYFDMVLKNLTSQDFELLAFLTNNSVSNPLFSKSREEIMSETGLSKAIFRKIITRLEALLFIETVSAGRELNYFITPHGLEAYRQLELEVLKKQN